MKLKRVTAVLLAGVMAMGLVACGSGSDTAAAEAVKACSDTPHPSFLSSACLYP